MIRKNDCEMVVWFKRKNIQVYHLLFGQVVRPRKNQTNAKYVQAL